MNDFNLSDVPASVYRFQLNAEFPLSKAIRYLPYLKDLGVEGIYCSPFYDAYSPHGYDVTDPNRLNPQIGSPEEFAEFCQTLKELGLKQIIDVVPNHMGFKGGKNAWWQDVLEKGPNSRFAIFFDIDWNPEKKELHNRVLLPILGAHYGTALENQEIRLHYDKGKFWVQYADYPLPIAPHTYGMILENYESATKKEIQKALVHLNGKKRVPESFGPLDRLLEAQFYRLSYWRVASHEINYRRFFNIHELVAIRIEEEEVLESHHKWLFELIQEGHVQGLRIDHPDGLYDPVTYFQRLRARYPIYTVVEKILDRKEDLPESWKVEGTVGYDYLNVLNGVFIDQGNEKAFDAIYEEFLGGAPDFDETIYQSKKLLALYEMVSEVEALGLKLDRLSEQSRYYRDFTRHDLTKALAEVIACFPVYRTYIAPEGKVSKRDSRYLTTAIEKAKKRANDLDPSIFDFVEKLLRIKLKNQKGYREFVLQFQQLTAPMMAKGLEDTTFYVYNRFISLNEVGGDPPHFGYSIDDFHRFNQEKLKKWPLGFVASSTHDTKRSEDVRYRLNVLSEIPQQWRLEVKKWSMATGKYKGIGPTLNTEYFIYQLLVGVWPTHPLKKGEYDELAERLWEVVLKSIREAKQETSWMFPNEEYEEAVRSFFFSILKPDKHNTFLKYFLPFQKQVHRLGSLNSLSASVLKIASCGVVDIYQGNELLNYRLVDPDNRRPVDFELRKKELALIKRADPIKLMATQDYSRLKGYLHWKALHFRKDHRPLFLEGKYLPLKVRGQKKEHVIAFSRIHENERLIVLAGRFFSSLGLGWGDTEVVIPQEWQKIEWIEIFTGSSAFLKSRGSYRSLLVAEIFQHLPFGYIYGENRSVDMAARSRS
ncbi:MAG: malto-oligosyltrehalose synthase [Chlamydiales bacterium]|nr:malto-oligosyltrehalose synthase [Chlamydiales bacterium]